jgi:RNA polymerase sigma factor (sigma-70 family)
MNVRTSFEEIYRLHRNAVYRVGMRAVSRREVAEELTSEVFLALHQSWETLTEEQLPAWLFTVAKRRAADYWRNHCVQEHWLQDRREDIRWTEPEFKLEILLERCPQPEADSPGLHHFAFRPRDVPRRDCAGDTPHRVTGKGSFAIRFTTASAADVGSSQIRD